jgi:hypothetical protein
MDLELEGIILLGLGLINYLNSDELQIWCCLGHSFDLG